MLKPVWADSRRQTAYAFKAVEGTQARAGLDVGWVGVRLDHAYRLSFIVNGCVYPAIEVKIAEKWMAEEPLTLRGDEIRIYGGCVGHGDSIVAHGDGIGAIKGHGKGGVKNC